jgi:hypothetical protein
MSSNNPDWLDISAIVTAFEQMNKVDIVLIGKVESVRGNKELVFLIQAEQENPESMVATILASVKCHLGSGDHRTMEGAIMWALYQLDWALAKGEMEGNKKTA